MGNIIWRTLNPLNFLLKEVVFAQFSKLKAENREIGNQEIWLKGKKQWSRHDLKAEQDWGSFCFIVPSSCSVSCSYWREPIAEANGVWIIITGHFSIEQNAFYASVLKTLVKLGAWPVLASLHGGRNWSFGNGALMHKVSYASGKA